MSQDIIEQVLGRLITDKRFRNHAEYSLEDACQREGYTVSENEMPLLSDIDIKLFNALSALLDPGLMR